MKISLLKKFCEIKSIEETANYFSISRDKFFEELERICDVIDNNRTLQETKSIINSSESIIAYTDGASSNNPGPAGIGIVFLQKEKIFHTVSSYIGRKTNNEAEYFAFIEAMKLSLGWGIKSIKIYSDSELMVKQINGLYKVKQSNLQNLYNEAKSLIKSFNSFEIEHISRNLNFDADKLAKGAIEHNDREAHS